MALTLYGEFIRLVEEFNRRDLRYAVIGGLAVAFHARPRATDDLDFLFFSRDIEKIRAAMHATGYLFAADPWTFQNTNITLHRFTKFEGTEHLIVDVMVSEEKKYTDVIEQAVVAETAAGLIRFANKEHLIWLKKMRNSKLDQADIEAIENAQRGSDDSQS